MSYDPFHHLTNDEFIARLLQVVPPEFIPHIEEIMFGRDVEEILEEIESLRDDLGTSEQECAEVQLSYDTLMSKYKKTVAALREYSTELNPSGVANVTCTYADNALKG